jgi:F-type H+-transporting ATPase subunit epsilon
MADPFLFELVSPERLLLSEQALEVVVPGSEGQFTVLKGHAPLMTTLRPGLIEVKLASGTADRIFVRGGFADANPHGLTILAEQAIRVADLDAAMITAEIRNAEEDVADAKDPAAKVAAEQKLNQLREVQGVLSHGTGAAH